MRDTEDQCSKRAPMGYRVLFVFECVVDLSIVVAVSCRDSLNKFPTDIVHHLVKWRTSVGCVIGRHGYIEVLTRVNRSGLLNRRSVGRYHTG